VLPETPRPAANGIGLMGRNRENSTMKTRLFPYLYLLCAALLIFLSPQPANAQDQDQQYQDQQGQALPGRVAELDYAQGSVSFEPSGEQDWVQAEVNRPLTTGDNLWSDQDSRAEVFIGSTALRLGDSTGISFLNLNDQIVQVQLAEGTLEVNVRYLDPNEAYEVDTPNLALSIDRPGEYVIHTDANGDSTSVAVYSGEGTVTGGGQSYSVTPGRRAFFTGTNQLSQNVQGLPAPDSFDSWARSREMREEHSAAAHYVAPGVTGYENLDEYGSWRSDPNYGNYWVPNDVSSDWVPYHVGHWAWVAPWGWTWVDAEPWGFAPFHYGRWADIDGRWGWIPGPATVAPIYAPALVGFVGGGGFGVAVGFGSTVGVGWFPLGPRDVYMPPYQVDERYVERINDCDSRYVNRTVVTNVYNNYTVNHMTNINYTYVNDTHAVTVVNREAFVSGQRVERGAIHIDPAQLSHPRVVTTATLTPSHTSVVGAAVARARTAPPARSATHRVVTKLKPSPRAEPLGRPRPATNPNLTTAVLSRSGYSPQIQLVRAKAAANAPVRATAPALRAHSLSRPDQPPARPGTAARPTPARPNAQPPRATPNRPTPTARPESPAARPTPARPEARPAHPAEPGHPAVNRPRFPRSQPTPNTAWPEHRFTPPSPPAMKPRPAPNQLRPAFPPRKRPGPTPNRAEPNRPITRPSPQPERPNQPNATPNRPYERPAARPQPQPMPNRETSSRPPVREPARPAPPPPRREARPSAQRPAARREARPQPKPQPPKPQPEKKKPGGRGGNGGL
jgi:Family of unknown function (DUF6600)